MKFCRLSVFTGRFEQVSFEQINEAYSSMRGVDAPWSVLPLPRSPWHEWRTIVRAAVRFWRYAYRVIGQFLSELAKARTPGDEKELQPGDVIISVGSSWVGHNFSGHIATLKEHYNVRFVQLVHDVIPILYPSWTPWFARTFRRWVKNIASVSDVLVTNSNFSRRDLEAFALEERMPVPPIRIVRFGTGFPSGFRLQSRVSSHARHDVMQSLPGRFVLCVSTIENRKNHRLLFNVWRSLLASHDAENVPHLVLAGRVGYFVLDTVRVRAKLRDRTLQERIIAVGQLSDADVAEVYRRCLFTVFPSSYEGWGLPIEESLLHGKFCVSSSSSSMPEVGGDWVDYFDPNDTAEAQRALERVLFEPATSKHASSAFETTIVHTPGAIALLN